MKNFAPYDDLDRQPGPIMFTTTDLPTIEWYRDAVMQREPVTVKVPQWQGQCYVIEVKVSEPNIGTIEGTITLQPTGAPRVMHDVIDNFRAGLARRIAEELKKIMAPDPRISQAIRAINAVEALRLRAMQAGLRADHADMDRCIVTDDATKATEATSEVERQRIIDWYSRPIHQEKEKEKSMDLKLDRATIKANRFYIGSTRALRGGWAKPTLQAAIDHAKDLIEKGDDGDEHFIVKIVKVVRRKPQPIVVEDVK